MNKELVTRYNEVVGPDDDIYCLGDLMLNDNEGALKLIKQLKGRIHVIRGNHCTETRMDLYCQCYNIVEVCEGKFLNYKHYHFYLSHYPCLTSNYDSDKPLKSRVISLCGHSHTKDPFLDWDKGMIFHVEVDSNNGYPWNIDDIINKVKEKMNNG